MFAKINSIGLFGLNAFPVITEISTGNGSPIFEIGGLADASVQESKQRILAALQNSYLNVKPQKIVVNLAPANIKKSGSAFDFAISTAILYSHNVIKRSLDKCAFIGEISLNGDLAPISGALPMALCAAENGIEELYLPAANAKEASVAENIRIYGVKNLVELVDHFNGKKELSPQAHFVPEPELSAFNLDFADVHGQDMVKNAVEIAAAGFHNMLMIGPPGTGKSMIAKRIPTIMPPMHFRESIETTQVHSVAGILNSTSPLVVTRPFRSVSHTASSTGLVGGGSIPKPGEISLAHNGVLFLDELPEFDKRVLESLRQPLEDNEITISRAAGSVKYPCNIMLVAAMNPCQCGNFGSIKPCTCKSGMVSKYLSKISQPVLDRIDIQVEVSSITYDDINNKRQERSSNEMRENVLKAREIQEKRFRNTDIHFNSEITSSMLSEYCQLDSAAENLFKNCFDRLGLSARAYSRILKVARTAADIDGNEIITKKHISQAISYRSLDRKYWTNK